MPTHTLISDPLRNFKFRLIIPHANMLNLGFMGASGLSVSTELIAYREGGDNTVTRKMPGQSDFGPITLSRGMQIGSGQAWNWFLEIFSVQQGGGAGSAGNNFRADFDLQVLDHPITSGEPGIKAAYKVYNAWPMSMAYSDFDAGGNGIVIEQMTLAHEGFDVTWL